MKYTLDDIAGICGGALTGSDNLARSVFTDSRSHSPGEDPLFVAIAGVNHDGHNFIGELFARGVRAFIVERDVDPMMYPGAGFVRVGNSVQALQALAVHHRGRFAGTVVGITGSNGKTIVKEWIAQLCPAEVKVFRSPRSYNSQIGVPLSVLMIEGDEQLALIEAGISRPGEMEALERIIKPHVGIFTNIGDAHQENFAGVEAKLSEKLKLFAGAQTIIYSVHYAAVGEAMKRHFADRKLVPVMWEKYVPGLFSDRASGEDMALSVAFCDVMGWDHAATMERVRDVQPVAMRLEVKEGLNGSVIINDSYNSDINSLSIAVDYLKTVAEGRPTILILSDILQTGIPERQLYGRVASMVAQAGIDRVVGIGDVINRYGELFACRVDFYPTAERALAALGRDDVAGHAILIKGNRASRFESLGHALQQQNHTTTLEVDLDAMIHNLNAHRAVLAPGVKLMAMVKASGYGNGEYEVASMLRHQGVDYLAVAFADEGVRLRERGISMPVVVLNADEDSFEVMIFSRLEPEIYNFASLDNFLAALRRHGERDYPVHIKLDTGMHRLGFGRGDIEVLAEMLAANRHLVTVKTIFSHLAASDEPAHDDFTRGQIRIFDEMSSRIISTLPYKVMRHTANSAAIERFPEAQFDMCRLGIGLYGIGEVPGAKLLPVSTLRSRIVQIKEIPAGDSVGYGRAAMIDRPTRIATIPMGYADGLDRHLGLGRWSVLIGGKPAPTIGRICMDTCMVDITGIEAAEGDQVVIFGPAEGNRVQDMARVLDTIPYEIMTGISARVKRIFTKE